MALLAELGQVLVEAGMPEEFLVNNPMRLTPEDVEALQVCTLFVCGKLRGTPNCMCAGGLPQRHAH